jgi:hypothetical protein
MWYLANPSTAAARAAMGDDSPHLLGAILSPRQGNKLPEQAVFCIDNNCGPCATGEPGAAYPGDEAYLWLLLQLRDADGADPCDPDTSRCLFATAPDVLGDAAATLRRSRYMLGWIRHFGLPAALVAQNGLERLEVPWDDFDCLFLGGSAECVPCGYVRPWADRGLDRCPSCHRRLREWKLGDACRGLVAEAKRRGKWVHMGRVNSLKRLAYADDIGCDSCDGTFLVPAPDVNLPKLLAWLATVNGERPAALFGVAS